MINIYGYVRVSTKDQNEDETSAIAWIVCDIAKCFLLTVQNAKLVHE